MEVNKSEAERAFDLAEQYKAQGQWERALKFYKTSIKLYPTEQSKQALLQLELLLQSQSSPSNNSHRSSGTNNSGSSDTPSPTSTPVEYTVEQFEFVQKTLKCKDYYEILGVTKTATETDIKKSYKKLALQMHPDKNKAPKSEEAFKKIGQAFACLSNPEKRKTYDLRGNDEPAPVFTRRSYSHQADFDDLTPEEIFQMFFGGGVPAQMRRGGNTHFRTYTYQPFSTNRTQSSNGEHSNGLFGLVQLLPLILLLALTFLFNPSEPVFQLRKIAPYTVQRSTLTTDLKYWVKPDFASIYENDPKNLRYIENLVEETWVKEKKHECSYEMIQKRKLHSRAEYTGYEADKKRAETFETTSCNQLKAKGFV